MLARSMRCRPSEVLGEDATQVKLWALFEEVRADVIERKRKQADNRRRRGRK